MIDEFFTKYLYGTEELPLEGLLSEVGIKFNLRPTISVDDKGGKISEDNNQLNPVSIGARFANNNTGAKITQVFSKESAEQAGLSAGDVIIAINDLQINKSNINGIINRYSVGDEIIIHAFRRDELKVFKLTLNAAELTTCYLQTDDKTNTEQKEKQKKWLFL